MKAAFNFRRPFVALFSEISPRPTALPLLRAARQLARHTDKAVPLKTAYFRFRYYSGKTLTLWEIYLL
jgi:hypothetical protein